MIYSRLTNTELERRVYCDRTNTEALAELVSRLPSMVEDEHDDMIQTNEQLQEDIDALKTANSQLVDSLREKLDHCCGVKDELAKDLAEAEQDFDEINALLIAAKVRIAELTDATDLV